MTQTETAPLLARWEEATGLVGLRFDAPDALRAGYTVPGQYVQVSLEGQKPGYLALASRPGDAAFEFLVKDEGFGAAMAALQPGQVAGFGAVAGQGYALDANTGHDVLVFAGGSGMAPLRPLLWAIAAHRAEFGAVRLWYGGQSLAHLAFRADWPAWEAADIEIHGVLSRSDEEGFKKGYVQHQLADLAISPARTVAFACGPKGMVEGLKETLGGLGLPADRVLQNY